MRLPFLAACLHLVVSASAARKPAAAEPQPALPVSPSEVSPLGGLLFSACGTLAHGAFFSLQYTALRVGDLDSIVRVDAYIDLACADTQDAWPTLKKVMTTYDGKGVEFRYHLFPLPYHTVSTGPHQTSMLGYTGGGGERGTYVSSRTGGRSTLEEVH